MSNSPGQWQVAARDKICGLAHILTR